MVVEMVNKMKWKETTRDPDGKKKPQSVSCFRLKDGAERKTGKGQKGKEMTRTSSDRTGQTQDKKDRECGQFIK